MRKTLDYFFFSFDLHIILSLFNKAPCAVFAARFLLLFLQDAESFCIFKNRLVQCQGLSPKFLFDLDFTFVSKVFNNLP